MTIRKKVPEAKRWLKKRYYSKQAPAEIEVIVRSVGGGGTTTLISYLSKYRKLNSPIDSDGLKHARNLKLANGQKQILILSDSIDVYRSLRRRSYLKINSLKLGFINYFFNKKSLFLFECDQLQKGWLSENMNNENTLVLHYDRLFESAEKIKKHLNITENNFERFFPERKERSLSK